MKRVIIILILLFSFSSITYAFDYNPKELYLGLTIEEIREKGTALNKLMFCNINNRGHYEEHYKADLNVTFLNKNVTEQHFYLFDNKSYIATSIFPVEEQDTFVKLLKNKFGEPVKTPKNNNGFSYTIYCWENDTIKIELRYNQPHTTSSTMLYIIHKPTLSRINKEKTKRIMPYKNEQKDFDGIKLGMHLDEIRSLGYTLEIKYNGKETDTITHYVITNRNSDINNIKCEINCSFFKNKLKELFITYKESDGVNFKQLFDNDVNNYGMPTEFIPLSEIACWSGQDIVVLTQKLLLLNTDKKVFFTSITSKSIEAEYKKFKQNK